MAVDTGLGVAITASADTLTGWLFVDVDTGQRTLTKVQTSHLGTTGSHTYIPGDLIDEGEVSGNMHFDPELVVGEFASLGTVQTLTITYPKSVSANTQQASLVGTGFFTGDSYGTFAMDTPGSRPFSWVWDSAPTFQEET